MPRFLFTSQRVQVGACGLAALILEGADGAQIAVRLTHAEAQALVSEQARIPSGRTRLAHLVGQLLDASGLAGAAVELRCADGAVSAELTAGAGSVCLPLAVADGAALAQTLGLPIIGDDSLLPVLRQFAQEPELVLPAAVTAFLDTLE